MGSTQSTWDFLEDTCGARRERKGNMKETFGVPVRSTYTKEVVLLVCAAVATGTSILLFVMSMSSRHWIFVSTKAAYKWVPYLTFDLGLLGGVATMHAQAGALKTSPLFLSSTRTATSIVPTTSASRSTRQGWSASSCSSWGTCSPRLDPLGRTSTTRSATGT